MVHKSYRVQKACTNCKNCFTLREFDSVNSYYCMLDAPKRPLCGSVLMDEPFDYRNKKGEKLFNKQIRSWDKWSENREVCSFGICDKWEWEKKQ